MELRHYILVNGKPELTDLMTWMNWFKDEDLRKIRWSEDESGTSVSTIFIGLNMNFLGPSLLYETMVFFKDWENVEHNVCSRCATREQALAAHRRFVKRYLKGKITHTKPPKPAKVPKTFIQAFSTINDKQQN